MKILIYGGGSVGLGIASCLLKSYQQVDIIARENTASSLRENGLKRTGIFGDFHAPPSSFNCYSSLKEVESIVYDLILVCTKSYDSCSAAKDISLHHSMLNNKTRIILFQNGWGNAEVFTSFFPRKQIYNARVITGFCRPEKNHVDITVHAEAVHIGSLFSGNLSGMGNLSKSINEGGIPCEVTSEIGKDLWAKMLYNCALNPLGAIFDVPYGILGEWDYTRNIMRGIVEEVFLVMEGAGFVTHWTCAEDYLSAFYKRLLPPTAKHESSMLQDIHTQKRTEIDALNGAVVRLGEKLNITTPYNSIAYNMVKFLEAKNLLEKKLRH